MLKCFSEMKECLLDCPTLLKSSKVVRCDYESNVTIFFTYLNGHCGVVPLQVSQGNSSVLDEYFD